MAEWLKASILKIDINTFYHRFESYFIYSLDSSVVEHRVENPWAMGSNPILDRKLKKLSVMIKKYSVLNRPISPHLTIYIPLNSSVFSIWHRFTAVLLSFMLIFFLSIFKFTVICYPLWNIYLLFNNFNIFMLKAWTLNFFWVFIIIIFFYHFLNGLRHLYWDIGFFLTKKSIIYSAVLISIIILIIMFSQIINLI